MMKTLSEEIAKLEQEVKNKTKLEQHVNFLYELKKSISFVCQKAKLAVVLTLLLAGLVKADGINLYSQVQWFGNPSVVPRIVETFGGPITSNVVTPGLISTGGAFIDEGVLNIGIPFSISMSNCFRCAFSVVYLELNRPGGFGYFYEAGIEYINQFKHDRDHDRDLDISSVLSFEFTGLYPGIYEFDAGAVNFFDRDNRKDLIQTPEPSIMMLLAGALALILFKYAYSSNLVWRHERHAIAVGKP
jgi:hypothetical protein